jgi:prepilin-type N-terminal cleavage/methylation domain-containing protein
VKTINALRGKSSGFTLIELLVVIAIIGILAATVLVSLNSARQKSRDARRLADVRQVMTALELFYNDNNRYPVAAASVPQATDGTPAFSTYLQVFPTAPAPADGSCGASNTYTYTAGVGQTSYALAFCIGAATGGFSAGAHSATQNGLQ